MSRFEVKFVLLDLYLSTGVNQIEKSFPFEICSVTLCHYSPLIGCFVPLIYVPKDLAGDNGFGSASLILIQSLYIELYGVERMSVWFSRATGYSKVLYFYRKLGFYPVQAQFLPVPYLLRDQLCQRLHDVNGIDYFLTYHKRINKIPKARIPTQLQEENIREDLTLTCESCGLSCNSDEEGHGTFTFCTHQQNEPSRFILQKNGKNHSICGITLCFSCMNSFNYEDSYNRCPVHLGKRDGKEAKKGEEDNVYIPIGDKCRSFIDYISKIIKENPKIFFSSCYEGHKGFESGNDDEPFCRHCLSHKRMSKYLEKYKHICHDSRSTEYTLQPFQRYSYCVNSNLPQLLTNVVHDVNSLFHISKMNQIQKNFVTCNLSSMSVEHPLFFDNNINKPSSILQNRVFGLRGIEGFGDCGFLCIYYGIISSPVRKEIISNITNYVNEKNENLPSLFSMQSLRKSLRATRSSTGIVGKKKKEEDFSIAVLREALFLARIDIHPGKPYIDIDSSEVIMSRLFYEYKDIHESWKSKVEKVSNFLDDKFFEREEDSKKKMYSVAKDVVLLKENFVHNTTSNEHYGVLWANSTDMSLLPLITGGLVGCVTVNDNKDFSRNTFHSSCGLSDGGFNFLNKDMHIFNLCKNFLLVRYINDNHFELFYDRREHVATFQVPEDLENVEPSKEYAPYLTLTQLLDESNYYIFTGLHLKKEDTLETQISNEMKDLKLLETHAFTQDLRSFSSLSPELTNYIEKDNICEKLESTLPWIDFANKYQLSQNNKDKLSLENENQESQVSNEGTESLLVKDTEIEMNEENPTTTEKDSSEKKTETDKSTPSPSLPEGKIDGSESNAESPTAIGEPHRSENKPESQPPLLEASENDDKIDDKKTDTSLVIDSEVDNNIPELEKEKSSTSNLSEQVCDLLINLKENEGIPIVFVKYENCEGEGYLCSDSENFKDFIAVITKVSAKNELFHVGDFRCESYSNNSRKVIPQHIEDFFCKDSNTSYIGRVLSKSDLMKKHVEKKWIIASPQHLNTCKKWCLYHILLQESFNAGMFEKGIFEYDINFKEIFKDEQHLLEPGGTKKYSDYEKSLSSFIRTINERSCRYYKPQQLVGEEKKSSKKVTNYFDEFLSWHQLTRILHGRSSPEHYDFENLETIKAIIGQNEWKLPIIINHEEFDNPLRFIKYLCIVQASNKKITFADANGEEYHRVKYPSKYVQESLFSGKSISRMNMQQLFDLFKNKKLRFPTLEDLTQVQCQLLYNFFLLKVSDEGLFSNKILTMYGITAICKDWESISFLTECSRLFCVHSRNNVQKQMFYRIYTMFKRENDSKNFIQHFRTFGMDFDSRSMDFYFEKRIDKKYRSEFTRSFVMKTRETLKNIFAIFFSQNASLQKLEDVIGKNINEFLQYIVGDEFLQQFTNRASLDGTDNSYNSSRGIEKQSVATSTATTVEKDAPSNSERAGKQALVAAATALSSEGKSVNNSSLDSSNLPENNKMTMKETAQTQKRHFHWMKYLMFLEKHDFYSIFGSVVVLSEESKFFSTESMFAMLVSTYHLKKSYAVKKAINKYIIESIKNKKGHRLNNGTNQIIKDHIEYHRDVMGFALKHSMGYFDDIAVVYEENKFKEKEFQEAFQFDDNQVESKKRKHDDGQPTFDVFSDSSIMTSATRDSLSHFTKNTNQTVMSTVHRKMQQRIGVFLKQLQIEEISKKIKQSEDHISDVLRSVSLRKYESTRTFEWENQKYEPNDACFNFYKHGTLCYHQVRDIFIPKKKLSYDVWNKAIFLFMNDHRSKETKYNFFCFDLKFHRFFKEGKYADIYFSYQNNPTMKPLIQDKYDCVILPWIIKDSFQNSISIIYIFNLKDKMYSILNIGDLSNEKLQSHLQNGLKLLGFLLVLFSKTKITKKIIEEELSSYEIRISIIENHWGNNKETGDVDINLLGTIYWMMNSEESSLIETCRTVLHPDTCNAHRQFLFRFFSFCHGHQNMLGLFKKENNKDDEVVWLNNDEDTPFRDITLKQEDSRKHVDTYIEWNTTHINGDEVSLITHDTTLAQSTRSDGNKSKISLKNSNQPNEDTKTSDIVKDSEDLEDTESDNCREKL